MSALQSIVENLTERESERDEATSIAKKLAKEFGSAKAAEQAIRKAMKPSPGKAGLNVNKALRTLGALKRLSEGRSFGEVAAEEEAAREAFEADEADALADFTAEVQSRAREPQVAVDLSTRQGINNTMELPKTPDQLWESVNNMVPGLLVEKFGDASRTKAAKKMLAKALKTGGKGMDIKQIRLAHEYASYKGGAVAKKLSAMYSAALEQGAKKFDGVESVEADSDLSEAIKGMPRGPKTTVQDQVRWLSGEMHLVKSDGKTGDGGEDRALYLKMANTMQRLRAKAKKEGHKGGAVEGWAKAGVELATKPTKLKRREDEDENRRHGGLGKLDNPDALFESCLGHGTLTHLDEAKKKFKVGDIVRRTSKAMKSMGQGHLKSKQGKVTGYSGRFPTIQWQDRKDPVAQAEAGLEIDKKVTAAYRAQHGK